MDPEDLQGRAPRPGRAGSILIVVLAYLVAAAAAMATLMWTGDLHPIWRALIADVAATLVIFASSYLVKNSSMYDAYWSVIPPVIALWWMLQPTAVEAGVPARQWLLLALVSAWGARLTWNWLRGWSGLSHEDWRYIDLARKHGRAYWWVSFSGIHMFPTLLVFGGCLALWPAMNLEAPLGWQDAVAAAVTAFGIACEGIADNQLLRFRRSNPPKGSILETGIWSWSRHPNYFGEMTFWWGLFLFVGLRGTASAWTVVGSLAITLLFLGISIPMIEARHAERRPDWAAHARRVSRVFLRPPRRA